MRIIFDVGAYDGLPYLSDALRDKDLTVYAFEPNISMALKIKSQAPDNYHVFPVAISSKDGVTPYYENRGSRTNSILPFVEENANTWMRDTNYDTMLETVSMTLVPTLKLDTVIDCTGVQHIDFLEVDAQGADLQVIKSCEKNLNKIKEIMLEVCDIELYKGCPRSEEVISFMNERGFKVVRAEPSLHYRNIVFYNTR